MLDIIKIKYHQLIPKDTPTIDLLASQGVKLENYYVQPLCSPTRSTIMTGRYPSHTGIGPNVDRTDFPYKVPSRETFFPQLLKSLGYSTHMVGKWHLGSCDPKYHPTLRGFDTFIGYYDQSGDRNSSTCDQNEQQSIGHCIGESCSRNYSSMFFANECIKRIRNHKTQTRTKTSRSFYI